MGARLNRIGSTAIPGIWAKPIVDVLAEVDPASFDEVERALLRAGRPAMSREPHRLHFNEGCSPRGFAEKVFHLHVGAPGAGPRASGAQNTLRSRRGPRLLSA